MSEGSGKLDFFFFFGGGGLLLEKSDKNFKKLLFFPDKVFPISYIVISLCMKKNKKCLFLCSSIFGKNKKQAIALQVICLVLKNVLLTFSAHFTIDNNQ